MQPGKIKVFEPEGKEQKPDATANGDGEAASAPYVKKWNKLVSTTNWEKGKIIYEWRSALVAESASAKDYSDEAWSRRVEGVSGQHVGRLRRVHERFAGVQKSYKGLYWSHFQAALDWNDAEMWLEGAVQNHWSIGDMRNQRWEAMGSPPDQKPRAKDVVAEERDGDSEPSDAVSRKIESDWEKPREVDSPDHSEGPDFGDEKAVASVDTRLSEEAIRPFENLPELPADLHEAFEVFKLAILRHKMARWAEVPSAHVLSAIKALEQLVLAPSEV